MTSTLSANNPFGKDFFAGSINHGRNTYGNSFTIDSSISGSGLTANIWQASKNELLPPIRTQMARNGDSLARQIHESRLTESDHTLQNQRDRSSATSRARSTFQTKNNVSGKQSPITYPGNSSSITDPLSANSRSNNDSAALTPSSNISIADQFPAHVNTTRESSSRMTTSQSIHVTAKEFRPNPPLDPRRMPSADEIARPSPTDGNLHSASRTATFNQTWTQQDIDTGYNQIIRNDFHPVLLTTAAVYNNSEYFSGGRNNGYEIDRSLYNRNRSFQRFVAEPNQTQYYQSPQGCDASIPRNKMQFQSLVGNERNNYSNSDNHNSYHDLPIKQQINYRKPQYMEPRVVPNTQLYSIEWPPEDYYRKAANSYYSQASTATANPGLHDFSAYNYYADDTAGYGSQTYSSSSFQYSGSGLHDGRHDYYNDPALHLPHMNNDTAQERPPENQQIYRSPLLEEFRVNKSRKYELKDIHDHVVEFSGDQLGSRFIQQKLEVANSDEKDRIFNEVARDSRQLMTDVFGNYVIQKMFEHGNQSQKKLLANHMKGHVYALSLQMYGCRVVQKAFEHILTDQQGALIKELDGNVLKVVENQNGNHVVQKAIELIPGEHIQFIVDAHRGHVHHLSKHPYGCRVIQRMLEYCQPPAKRQILDELHLNISELIQDAFGNYVVQHVIVNGEPQDRKAVIDKVQSRLLENAMHKFASNVVEKALDNADDYQRRAMLQKLTGRDEGGQSTATRLLTHQYGNYVIQKSTAHLTGQTLATIIEEMESYLSQLQRVSSGKQVSALQKSIIEARKRLDRQSFGVNNLHYAPTRPRTGIGRR